MDLKCRLAGLTAATIIIGSAAACKARTDNANVLGDGVATSGAEAGANTNGDPTLLIAFAAKGTNVAVDGGFMHALFEQKLAAVEQGRVIVSGSSSGSIMTAIFGCYGVTQEGLDVMEETLKVFDKDKVDISDFDKGSKLLLGQGEWIMNPQSNLDPVINTLTRNKTCVPRFPMVITAGNHENLDAVWRLQTPDLSRWGNYLRSRQYSVPFYGVNNRKIDMNTYAVFDLSKGGNAPVYMGRGCTYFADPSMFKALQRVPSNQRLCDLRLIASASDLELAIRASVSEPTYFAPIYEHTLDSTNFVPATFNGQAGPSDHRVYNGGFPMTIVAQDIKRAYPEVYALGTGRTHFTGATLSLITNWYMLPLNEAMDRGRYWLDGEIPYTDAEYTGLWADGVTKDDNARTGLQKARDCFSGKVSCTAGPGMAAPITTDWSGKVDMKNGLLHRPLGPWLATQKGAESTAQ